MSLDWKLSYFETSAYEVIRQDLNASKEEKQWYVQSPDCSTAAQNTLPLVHLALITLGYSSNALSPHICCSPICPSIPRFIALRFIVFHRYGRGFCFVCFVLFLQIEGRSNPEASKSVGVIFPTALAPFLFLCHILVILTIFQILHQQKDYDSLKAQIMVSTF